MRMKISNRISVRFTTKEVFLILATLNGEDWREVIQNHQHPLFLGIMILTLNHHNQLFREFQASQLGRKKRKFLRI
jgi:hypothetical protein